MEAKFTIEEFKNYCSKQDSFGDIFYNLSEENIIKANEKNVDLEDEFHEGMWDLKE